MGLPNGLHHLAICTEISRTRLSSTRRSSGWIYARFTGCTALTEPSTVSSEWATVRSRSFNHPKSGRFNRQ